MFTRRTFIAGAVGATAAVACGASVGTAHAVPLAPDPRAVAAADAGRRPTAWGTALPGIASRFAPHGRQVALTFDACAGACDEALLDTLERHQVPALVFVCSRWIDANPGRTERLAANPSFDIGNHGTRHVPLSVTGRSAYRIAGTRSADEVVDEVSANQLRLTTLLGRAPEFFRPGTATYDDVGVQIVRDLGLTPVGFSINADNGATASAGAVAAAIGRVTPGSIVLAHANHPGSGTAPGVAAALPGLLAAGWQFVPLGGQALLG